MASHGSSSRSGPDIHLGRFLLLLCEEVIIRGLSLGFEIHGCSESNWSWWCMNLCFAVWWMANLLSPCRCPCKKLKSWESWECFNVHCVYGFKCFMHEWANGIEHKYFLLIVALLYLFYKMLHFGYHVIPSNTHPSPFSWGSNPRKFFIQRFIPFALSYRHG